MIGFTYEPLSVNVASAIPASVGANDTVIFAVVPAGTTTVEASRVYDFEPLKDAVKVCSMSPQFDTSNTWADDSPRMSLSNVSEVTELPAHARSAFALTSADVVYVISSLVILKRTFARSVK